MIDWGAYVFGLCVGLALGAFLTFAIVGTFAWNDGYKRAYADMKVGKIEDTMSKLFPEKWVQLNCGEAK